MNNDPRKNEEGYYDLTPYEAIKNIEKESGMRFYKLLYAIFDICDLAGFEVKGRIMLKDKKTGITYK